MKKRRLSAILPVLLFCLSILLTACGGGGADNGGDGKKTLATPFVSLSDSGLASWAAIENASGYTYKIDGGAEKNTTSLSVQLTDGQQIQVKAVGDGTNYTDSSYSSAQTYTAPATPPPSGGGDQGGNTNPPATPTVLSAPTVSIDANGLATWGAVSGASSYKYKIDGGAELTTSALSVQLTDGQSIEVKAVGDGTNYSDSNYSSPKTYTASTTPPDDSIEPDYLGIEVSKIRPTESNSTPPGVSLPQGAAYGQYRDFATACGEYYANEENRLGDTLPPESDFDIYANGGDTVFIKIWLNNPKQHTILSLMLDGTKYQVSGGLYSFFKEIDGEHYNCLYIEVTLPTGIYVSKTYEVSNIEYVSGKYINQDGTDSFMNDNDTVTVGLPYASENPKTSDYHEIERSYNKFSAEISISDAHGVIASSGGWLRGALYDGSRIIAQRSLTLGENSVSFNGLVENSYYYFIVYVYADLHDGNGVSAHILEQISIWTPNAITENTIDTDRDYDAENDRYYPVINVSTTLNSTTAEYIKLEVTDNNGTVVYTNNEYNGTDKVTGLLSETDYNVRVYYKDNEYPEGKYIERSLWTPGFYDVYLFDSGHYALYDDAVIWFRLGNNDPHPLVKGFTAYIYDDRSPQYIADDVLCLLDNPGIIDDLSSQISELENRIYGIDWSDYEAAYALSEQLHAERSALVKRLEPLEHAKGVWESEFGSNADRDYWTAESAKGKYYRTYTFSRTGDSDIFLKDKNYYIACEDYFKLHEYGEIRLGITAEIDKNNGKPTVVKEYDMYLGLENRFGSGFGGSELENITVDLSGNKITYTMYNDPENFNNCDDYDYDSDSTSYPTRYMIKSYVWKVTAYKISGEEVGKTVTLFISDEVPVPEIDEAAWLAAYINAVNNGLPTEEIAKQYVPAYADTMETEINTTGLDNGEWEIHIYTRRLAVDYESAWREYDREKIPDDKVLKTAPYPTPIIKVDDYGDATVAIPGYEDTQFPVYYQAVFEVLDTNGNVDTELSGRSDISLRGKIGYKFRAKLTNGGNSASAGYSDSEWTEWIVYAPRPIASPVITYNSEYGFATWEDVEYAESYVYRINGGSEVILSPYDRREIQILDGDTIEVKVIPIKNDWDPCFADSEWASYTFIDEREKIGTPLNVRFSDDGTHIIWDAVDGAEYYNIKNVKTGEIKETAYECIYYMGIGEFAFQAVPSDSVNYKPGDWSESIIYTKKLDDPSFKRTSGTRVYWNPVSDAEEYYYRINDGEETKSSSNRYLDISGIMQSGDSLYIQARTDGAESSNWVLIYTHA